MRTATPLVFAIFLIAAGSARAATIDSVVRVGDTGTFSPVPTGSLVEYEVRLGKSYADPFDPGVVNVRATFVVETGGQIDVDGFWYQDYGAAWEPGEPEVLAPRGDAHFRVRFRPVSGTRYGVTIQATDADGTAVREMPTLWASGLAVDEVVRLRGAGEPIGFQRGGRPYVPFGANVCWSGASGTADFAQWFGSMGGIDGNGLNWSRLWMTHFDGTALEWKAGADGGAYAGIGTYNLKAGWRVDQILHMAAASGIALQLVLQQHSQFECSQWSSWADNPWNAANGGPCATSMEFFTNPAVVEGFDRKVRYLVARYAHSPALMAWELWNEVDLIGGYDRAAVDAWSRGRVEKLRALDPYRHLVTTSYALPAFDDQDWAYEGFDFAQLHDYLAQYWDALPLFAPPLRAFGKPVVLGEFGIDTQGVENLEDRDGTHLVNATLLAVVSGYTGGAMSWWWDNWIEPKGLWRVLRNVMDVLGRLGVANVTGPLDDVAAIGDDLVEARAARTTRGALVWLHDAGSEWNRDPGWVAQKHAGVVVEVDGIASAGEPCRGIVSYGLPWTGWTWSPEEAGFYQAADLPGGGARFTAPEFERDLVIQVRCRGAEVPEDVVEAPDSPPDAADDSPEAADGGGDEFRRDVAATDDASPASDHGTLADEAPEPVRPKSGGCSARF